jgi:uncharacterized protein YecE (DUF72 family)
MNGSDHSILVGCTGWSYPEWKGAFYPAGTKPAAYLSWYSRHFSAVEIDSTFYRVPASRFVDSWRHHTPDDFRFTAKVPRRITHERRLRDCGHEVERFARAMEGLGHKLVGALLQLGYFSQTQFVDEDTFLKVLDDFLGEWPHAGLPLAVEIRNPRWVGTALTEVLRRHNAAFTLTIWDGMPRPAEVVRRVDPVTGPFAYIRLIRDRSTRSSAASGLNPHVTNDTEELTATARVARELGRSVPVVVVADNQFAGFAPATARQFRQILHALEPLPGAGSDSP